MNSYIFDYIRESNAIENEYGDQAFSDSVDAWHFLEAIKPRALTINDVLSVHRNVMRNLRPDIAGKFRTCDVTVGGRLCPSWKVVTRDIKSLLTAQPFSPISALDWHIRFERVHPFEDGNGRTGRLIYAYHCAKLGHNWLMFREKDKQGYHSLFDL